MKESWNIFKLGVYVFALPLVATAAASAHQWMTSNAVLAVVPPPAAVNSSAVTTITALRNHTITINEDGEVQGRIASINHKSKAAYGISEAAVYFIQEGKIVKKDYTNDDGTFVVEGLEPGIYSFAAAGEFSFATCGVNVVESDGGPQRYLELAAISPNVASVKKILEKELTDEVRNEIKKNFNEDAPANVMGSNRVELDGDVLAGQVVSLFTDRLSESSKAHLFKANAKVKEVAINRDGTFEVEGISPGVYDIVVTSPQGVAAVSFEAVASLDENVTEAYTSVQDSVFSTFIVALAPQADFGAIGGSFGNFGGAQDAVVYGDSPVGFLGDRLGGGIAGGGNCGGCSNFSNFGGCCGGGGRFGGLFGGRGLLIPAIAAGIAIPLAVGSNSETNVN